jgi:hypothetical protein
MLGPLLLIAVLTTAGAFSGGWAGAVVGAAVALLVTFAVAAAAAFWATRIGRLLDPEEAYRLAPRPPLFGALCDGIYRRVFGSATNG